eukprot:GEMP01004549.1.p1 GENE.GEMP01004549.1~~GEMP01004549.1.p1  ORF type:complete len:1029 (+),score=181.46 GEMP01004549.1:206-3292(+)
MATRQCALELGGDAKDAKDADNRNLNTKTPEAVGGKDAADAQEQNVKAQMRDSQGTTRKYGAQEENLGAKTRQEGTEKYAADAQEKDGTGVRYTKENDFTATTREDVEGQDGPDVRDAKEGFHRKKKRGCCREGLCGCARYQRKISPQKYARTSERKVVPECAISKKDFRAKTREHTEEEASVGVRDTGEKDFTATTREEVEGQDGTDVRDTKKKDIAGKTRENAKEEDFTGKTRANTTAKYAMDTPEKDISGTTHESAQEEGAQGAREKEEVVKGVEVNGRGTIAARNAEKDSKGVRDTRESNHEDAAKKHGASVRGAEENDFSADTRGNAKEQDVKNAYGCMFRLFKQLVGLVVISLVTVVVLVVLPTLITVECRSNPDMVFLPFWWHAIIKYGLFLALFDIYLLSALHAFFHPCLWLSQREMVFVCSPVILLMIAGWFVLEYDQDPGKIRFLRGAMGALSVVLFAFTFLRKATRAKYPSANGELQVLFRKNNIRIVKYVFLFIVIFVAVYYGSLYYAMQLYPLVTYAVERKFGKDSIIFIATEPLLVFMFFSIMFPLSEKALCASLEKWLSLCEFDPNRTTPYAWRTLFGLKRCSSYSLTSMDTEDRSTYHEGHEAYLTAQQIKLTRENMMLRGMVLCNFTVDVLRMMYLRGMLFTLSSVNVFLIIVFKDFFYELWNFGLKYMDWVLIFELRGIYNGEANRGRECQVLDILRFFNHCWDLPVDYAALESREGELTDRAAAIEIDFSSVTIVIVNLPESFEKKTLQVDGPMASRRFRIVDNVITVSDKVSALIFPASIIGIVTMLLFAGVRGIHSVFRVCNPQKNVESAKDAQVLVDSSKTTIAEGVECASTQKNSENLFETRASTSHIQELVAIIQSQIFFRYQTLAAASLFSSAIFLFVPLAAQFTATRHHVRFEEFDFFGVGEKSNRYRLAAILFLVMDITKWAGVTCFMIKNAKNPTAQMNFLSNMLSHRRTLFAMGSVAVFMGVFLFHEKWDPLNLSYINKQMGHSDDNAWTWRDVYEKCF